MKKQAFEIKKELMRLNNDIDRMMCYEEKIPFIDLAITLDRLKRMYEGVLEIMNLPAEVDANNFDFSEDTEIQSASPVPATQGTPEIESPASEGLVAEAAVEEVQDETAAEEPVIEEEPAQEPAPEEEIRVDEPIEVEAAKEEAPKSEEIIAEPEKTIEEVSVSEPVEEEVKDFNAEKIIEEHDSKENDILFEDNRDFDSQAEDIISEQESPAKETPAPTEHPTVWDSLQNQKSGTSWAEGYKAPSSISDKLSESPSQSVPEPQTKPAKNQSQMDMFGDLEDVIEEPQPEKAPEVPKEEPTIKKESSSLIDFLHSDTAKMSSLERTISGSNPPAQPKVEEPKAPEAKPIEPQPVKEEVKEAVAPKPQEAAPKTEPHSIADDASSKATSVLGERLIRNQSTMESAVRKNKIKDIRRAININDRFVFINELFKGNMQSFAKFIEKLNEIEDREVALDEVSKIAEQFDWDLNSLAVKTFFNIFDSKF